LIIISDVTRIKFWGPKK